MYRLLILILFFASSIFWAMAGKELNVSVTNYTTFNGLANNDVQFAFQDPKGYLWIGTKSGLSRFDGYHFFNHYPDPAKKNYFATGHFTCYQQLTDSSYLLGTLSDGAFILNSTKNTLRKLKNSPKSITCIFQQNAKIFWFGTLADGFYSYNLINNTKIHYTLKPLVNSFSEDWNNNTVDAIGMDASDATTLWLGCRSGLHSFKISTKKITTYLCMSNKTAMHQHSVNHIKCLNFSQQGTIWVGTFFGGLAQFDLRSKSWKRFLYNPENFEQKVLNDNIVLNILPYKNEQFLLSTSAGPIIFHLKTNTFTPFNLLASGKKLKGDVVHLSIDNHQNIWVSQIYQQGLSCISNSYNAVQNFPFPNQTEHNDYYASALTDLFYSKKRDSYFATVSNYDGIIEYSSNFQVKRKIKIPSYWDNNEPFTTSIAEDKNGNLWVTDIAGKLIKIDYESGKIELQEIANSGYCKKLVETNDRQLILHIENGLYRKKGNHWIKFIDKADVISKVMKNNLLIYSHNNTIHSYDFKTNESHFVAKLPIFCIEESNYIHEPFMDSKNRIWIPLEFGGIYRFDINHKKLEFFNNKDGLTINQTRRIIEDEWGRIFLMCAGGFYYFNEDLNRFSDFNSLLLNQNLLWSENFISLSKEANGNAQLLVSSNNCLFKINQHDVLRFSLKKPSISSIKIESTELFGAFSNFTLPDHQNSIELTFSNFDFAHTSEIIYEYQLNNNNWTRLSKGKNKVILNNLNEGNYLLKYRIAGNTNLSSFHFKVTEIWYKSQLFYRISISAILLAFVFFLVYYWRKEKIKRQLERQVIEFKLKALQSQLNPHFLFNCLTSISGLVKLGEYTRAQNTLHDFAKLMRKILMLSDEESIPLKDEIELSVLYLNIEKVRKDELFDYTVNLDETFNQFKVPPMTLQPFLENCVKHAFVKKDESDLGHITIDCFTEGEKLVLKISDNGVGFKLENDKTESVHQSKGIEIQKTRLVEFFKLQQQGVELILKNKPTGGAEVSIEINLDN